MRIGILTFHDTTNFGSLLQAYALYKKVRDLGYPCDVIDYQCDNIVKREIPRPFSFFVPIKTLVKEILFGKVIRRKYEALHQFLLTNVSLSQVYSSANIRDISHLYDKYIIGSDIVWGLDITGDDLAFFLNFEDNPTKKFAFSSSVGDEWSPSQKRIIKPLLKDFSSIAVRENESAGWVEELTGVRPPVVCDPTMLLTADDWRGFVLPRKDGGRYVLVYFNSGAKCLDDAKTYAKKYGLRVYFINYGIPMRGVRNIRPVYLEDFISLIHGAAFIFTASYHGMLFSIYFQKQFIFYNRAHKSRMCSLAKKLGLEDRCGDEVAHDDISIDYSRVKPVIECFRQQSIAILEAMLKK